MPSKDGGHEGLTICSRRTPVLDPRERSFLESLKRYETHARSLLERRPYSRLSPSKGRGDGRAISSQGGPSRVDTVEEQRSPGAAPDARDRDDDEMSAAGRPSRRRDLDRMDPEEGAVSSAVDEDSSTAAHARTSEMEFGG